MYWWQNLILSKYLHKGQSKGEIVQCIHIEPPESSNKAFSFCFCTGCFYVVWIHVTYDIHKLTLQLEPEIFIIIHICIQIRSWDIKYWNIPNLMCIHHQSGHYRFYVYSWWWSVFPGYVSPLCTTVSTCLPFNITVSLLLDEVNIFKWFTILFKCDHVGFVRDHTIPILYLRVFFYNWCNFELLE